MVYAPHPIATADVELDADILELTELLARNAHEVWAQQRMAEGWKYGPSRSDAAREHPGLIPYDDLSESEKEYDRKMAQETLKVILTLGYRMEKLNTADISEPEVVSEGLEKGDCMSAESNLSRQGDLFHLPPEAGDDKTLKTEAESRIKSIVDEFQADVTDAQKRWPEDIRRSAGYLVPEGDQLALLPRAKAILERYAVVDTLAIQYRDLTQLTFRRMLKVIFFAMLVFEFFSHIMPEFVFPIGTWPRMIVWLYPVLWLWAFFLWYRAHRRQYQKKYQDYRTLAEGLRVQFFWNLLGMPDPVEQYYLHKQEGELEWIRRALRLWRENDEKTIQDAGMTGDRRTVHKDLVYRLWVQAQLKYFKSTAGPREKGRSDTCKRWGTGLLWVSLALSLALAFSELRYVMNVPSHPHLGLPDEESILIFFIGTLLTAAALVIAYGEKMAFLEHARQYDVASKRFADSEKKLSPGPLTQTDVEELKDLGKDALQENGDWLLLHRDRPLEVIVP